MRTGMARSRYIIGARCRPAHDRSAEARTSSRSISVGGLLALLRLVGRRLLLLRVLLLVLVALMRAEGAAGRRRPGGRQRRRPRRISGSRPSRRGRGRCRRAAAWQRRGAGVAWVRPSMVAPPQRSPRLPVLSAAPGHHRRDPPERIAAGGE